MNGIIIINKPKNLTSNNVVNKVRHILNCKVGHTGTLDPNATGVLPLLLGDGTKFSKYLINHDKKYQAVLKLGIKMSTADVEGEVIEEKGVDDNIFSNEKLEEILSSFVGKQTQTPPIYSAIKVNGKKLYDYARRGIEVEVPSREIEIYGMDLISFDKEAKTITFDVQCSKGTYIRSLCEDIAEKLNTVGYMLELNRLRAR
ncbi:MAG: tRNA pseudouridine(55) synthase TruB [Clostridia bacterium]|nr:tRNA pseudouridine(55) synthase TruB [Clostridia bacterium]